MKLAWLFLGAILAILGGAHPVALAGGPPLINEIVVDNPQADTFEYVEIKGEPNTSYSAYTLVQIEGGGADPGNVDSLLPIGTTDADGYWVSDYLSNVFENGTATFLLVAGSTGTEDEDLDIDNDGILDSEPWAIVVDAVAIDSEEVGNHTYTSVVLDSSMDAVGTQPDGVSRIPDGVDTDTAADWVRNDSDGAGLPGQVGTPALGEALNTPGAPNDLVPDIESALVINEILVDNFQVDEFEFAEIKGLPNTDYSGYTLLQIEATGFTAGTIDSVTSLGTTDDAGYWRTEYFSNEFENSTTSWLLVFDFTGFDGDDIDTDNDGTMDYMPWSHIVDDVALSSGNFGDLIYSSVVLNPTMDAFGTQPDGASRIPDGVDTDSVGDWVRNDGDGAGLPMVGGTPELGEALNTPGKMNRLVPPLNESIVINELFFNPVGADFMEFIEVKGLPNTDYTGFAILQVNGDALDAGEIDTVHLIGTTGVDGYWTTDFLVGELENGSSTYLLVEDFSGAVNDDLDSNNDGVLDSTPWSTLVDDLSQTDNAESPVVYSTTVLTPTFDGDDIPISGASRIPDGVDTDTAADWVRGDRNGSGLPDETSLPDPGQAFYTPGEENMIYVPGEGEGEGEGEGDMSAIHTADQNGDNQIDLSELLRVIQFFNSAGYSCAIPPSSTEDGYQPGPGDESCTPHASDYNPQDFEVNLSELLRVIQFFNSVGYFFCPDMDPPTEDGFCPGAP